MTSCPETFSTQKALGLWKRTMGTFHEEIKDATRERLEGALKQLVSRGMDVNSEEFSQKIYPSDEPGQLLPWAMFAMCKGLIDRTAGLAAIEVLLAHGADPTLRDNQGYNTLDMATVGFHGAFRKPDDQTYAAIAAVLNHAPYEQGPGLASLEDLIERVEERGLDTPLRANVLAQLRAHKQSKQLNQDTQSPTRAAPRRSL